MSAVKLKEQAKSPKFKEIIDDMYQLHLSKSSDYTGDSPDVLANFRDSAEIAGITVFQSVMNLVGTKAARLKGLARKGYENIQNESLADTLKDMANYCVLAQIALQEMEEENEDS